MTLQLKEIRALGEDKYEVVFNDEGGAEERVVCRIIKHKGVSAVKMEPDIVMTNQPSRIQSREVVAAVLDYDRRYRERFGTEPTQ